MSYEFNNSDNKNKSGIGNNDDDDDDNNNNNNNNNNDINNNINNDDNKKIIKHDYKFEKVKYFIKFPNCSL